MLDIDDAFLASIRPGELCWHRGSISALLNCMMVLGRLPEWGIDCREGLSAAIFADLVVLDDLISEVCMKDAVA